MTAAYKATLELGDQQLTMTLPTGKAITVGADQLAGTMRTTKSEIRTDKRPYSERRGGYAAAAEATSYGVTFYQGEGISDVINVKDSSYEQQNTFIHEIMHHDKQIAGKPINWDDGHGPVFDQVIFDIIGPRR